MTRAPANDVDLAQVSRPGVDLWWIPLGAGGWFVRFNGRVYERVRAWRERRAPLELYHTALVVTTPEARHVIENAWPIPDEDGAARGVVVQGPVFSRGLARWRALRYEVRCWRDGRIPDAGWSRHAPDHLRDGVALAPRVLDLVARVPPRVWGRDELRVGEMWNSNSVIAWLLASAGFEMAAITPPRGGAAPGWRAGLWAASARQVDTGSRSPASVSIASRTQR